MDEQSLPAQDCYSRWTSRVCQPRTAIPDGRAEFASPELLFQMDEQSSPAMSAIPDGLPAQNCYSRRDYDISHSLLTMRCANSALRICLQCESQMIMIIKHVLSLYVSEAHPFCQKFSSTIHIDGEALRASNAC